MYIKLNKITLYVNFKNRICNHTHYTNRGHIFTFIPKTTSLITLLTKNIQQLFLQPHKYIWRIKQYTTQLTRNK